MVNKLADIQHTKAKCCGGDGMGSQSTMKEIRSIWKKCFFFNLT